MSSLAADTTVPLVPALSTPALVVDLDVFDANVAAMAGTAGGHRQDGPAPRQDAPHAGARAPPARRAGRRAHLRHGGRGRGDGRGRASTTSSSRTRSSIPPRSTGWWRSRRRARVAVAVDDPEPIEALSPRRRGAGVTIGVLIDVDILLHRCGVASAAEARAPGRRRSRRSPGLELRGIMGYEGRVRLSRARTATGRSRAPTPTLADARRGPARRRLPRRHRVGRRARRRSARPSRTRRSPSSRPACTR